MPPNLNRFAGEGVLLAITCIWGTTFAALANGLRSWPPHWLSAVRFAIGALVLLPWLRWQHCQRGLLRRGCLLGLFAFGGFSLQTISLTYTSEAHCAFGSALVTVFVPLVNKLLGRQRGHHLLMSLSWALLGVLLLFGGDLLQPRSSRWGDLYALLGALAFAVQIVLLAQYAREDKNAFVGLVFWQLSCVMLLSGIAALGTGQPASVLSATFATLTWRSYALLFYLGAVATALALLGQAYGQARTSAFKAALIFALEPIFAALIGWLLHGQRLSHVEIAGGVCIVLAALSGDTPPPRWTPRRRAALFSPKHPEIAAAAAPPPPPAPDAHDAHRPS